MATGIDRTGPFQNVRYQAPLSAPDQIKETLEKFGVCLVKGVFTPTEIDSLRKSMATTQAGFNQQPADLMSCPELRWVLFDLRVLSLAKTLLGPTLSYYAETHFDYEEDIGPLTQKPYNTLHIDAVGTPEKLTRIWRGQDDQIYRGYRFAVYFQDYAQFSGGLKVVIGSHLGNPDRFQFDRRDLKLKSQLKLPSATLSIPAPDYELFNVPAQPGDLVIWNLRTVHAAGAQLLTEAPELALHPDVETSIKASAAQLIRPIPGPRVALFFDYGAPSLEIDLYIKWRALRMNVARGIAPEHYSYDSPDVAALADRHGIKLRFDRLIGVAACAILDRIVALDKEGKLEDPGKIPPHLVGLGQRLERLASSHAEYCEHHQLFDMAKFATLKNASLDEKVLFLVSDMFGRNRG